MVEGMAKREVIGETASYIEKTKFSTPNGEITFTQDHAVENTPVEIQVIRGGVAVPYGR